MLNKTQWLSLRDSPDYIPLKDTPSTDTPRRKSFAYPSIADSNPYTPYFGSNHGSPRLGSSVQRKPWFVCSWRGGSKIAFILTALILTINVALLAYFNTAFEKMAGFPVIFRGSCESAEYQNRNWHLLINVLSTIALGASNYCMQLLSAPNRSTINAAHVDRRFLDIGVPSLRNLRFMSNTKRVAWSLLALSSVPLHLVYNSVFYAAIATHDYNILYATETFTQGDAYDHVAFPDTASQNVSAFQSSAAQWKRLENRHCISKYAETFLTEYRNVIAVVVDAIGSDVRNNTSLLEIVTNDLPSSSHIGPTYDAFAWICNDTTVQKDAIDLTLCSAVAPSLEQLPGTEWRSGGFNISYCLAEPGSLDCHLHFAPQLMGPVIVMNVVKLIAMFYAAFLIQDKPLITLGDAVESFIQYPDPVTQSMSMITASEVEGLCKRKHMFQCIPQAKQFYRNRAYFATVVSRRQWLVISVTSCLIFVLLLTAAASGTLRLSPATIRNAWSLGLGTVSTQNLITDWSLPQLGTNAVLVTALIANTPQIVLSFVYILYNMVFTLFHLGESWDSFSPSTAQSGMVKIRSRRSEGSHRTLRVSEPRGDQRSSYFLTLPLRYAIPLLVFSGLLHWLASQSVFLANVSVIPRDGSLPRQDEITTVSYSVQGFIWLMILCLAAFVFLIVNARRKFSGGMIVVGSNSIAISAACHVNATAEERLAMARRPLAWGEIPDPRHDDSLNGLGFVNETSDGPMQFHDAESTQPTAEDSHVARCGFSDGPVLSPGKGRLYIQLSEVK